ncbi:MAG: flagellin [Planctomycetota bacterium]
MSSIPSNIGRTSSLLISSIQLNNLTRTNLDLFEVQAQLSTGRSVIRPSDDAAKASTIGVLDDRIERSAQVLRNLDQADTRYAAIETALSEANDLLLEAQTIASEEVGLGSTAESRAARALVVRSQIDGLLDVVNTTQDGDYLFGGSRLSSPPFESFGTGVRYVGETDRLTADLNLGSSTPVTLSGAQAIGDDLARVLGTVDLDPDLTPQTRLSDLQAPGGGPVSLGEITFRVGAGAQATIDLTGAETVDDVAARLTNAIREYEATNNVTVLGPGGVGVAGKSLSIDVAGASPGAVRFQNVGVARVATDLGLAAPPPTSVVTVVAPVEFTPISATGLTLEPRVTLETPVAALAGVGAPLGSVRISNAGESAVIDLSTAATIEEVKSAIEGAGLGVRVEINAAGDGLNIANQVATAPDDGLSIEEVPGGPSTATLLGIRTLSADTRLDAFNDGRGVSIVSGSTDPVTGLPDPDRDVDFVVTLGDGTSFPVDLLPQDASTVGTLVTRINAAAAAAGVAVPADFEAGLTDGPNGIALRQSGAFAGSISIERQNNSPAAEQLGLLEGTYDAASATLTGTDRAKVVVDSLFSRLLGLERALNDNDTSGITFAGEKLDGVVDRVSESRALVGGFSRRTQSAVRREEDLLLIDEQVRSELRDLDFAEGATRLTQLQTQLQAGLQTSAITQQLTLLNFLG